MRGLRERERIRNASHGHQGMPPGSTGEVYRVNSYTLGSVPAALLTTSVLVTLSL